MYQWRTTNTIVQSIYQEFRIYFKSSREYIIYDVSIKVSDDDDDVYKGEKAGGWTAGLYQWRTIDTIIQNISRV